MMRICVTGGDGRMDHAANALQKKEYEVTRELCLPGLDALVLPVWQSVVTPEQLQAVLQNGGAVIGGGLPVLGQRSFDYMKNEAFLYENARITAEGAVMLLGAATDRTLYGADIGILGMGRIAECLCMMLRGIGAKVTVYARRPEVLCRARAMGADAVCFAQKPPLQIVGHDFICNTVPHLLLDAELLSHAKKDAVLVELASAPGGFDCVSAEQFGLRMIHGQGLPGRYAPCAAGELIATYTDGVLKGEITA